MKALYLIGSRKRTGPNIAATLLQDAFENDSDVEFRVFDNWKIYLKTIREITKFDVIHFYTQTFFIGSFVHLCFLLRKTIIYTVHGDIQSETNSQKGLMGAFKKIFWIPIHKYIFYVSKGITFPSHFSQRINENFIKNVGNTVVIHNGYDFSNIKRNKNKKIGQIKKLLIITSFNHTGKQQGIDYIASVLSILNSSKNEYIIQIIGGGANLEAYKEKYSGRKDMEFLGYREDTNVFLENSDLFFYISFLDNVPVVILEAIAYGLPVVTCPTGGIPEMINTTDTIIDSNTQEHVNVITKLISSENYYKEIAERQYEYAKQKFNLQDVAKELKKYYSDLFLNKKVNKQQE